MKEKQEYNITNIVKLAGAFIVLAKHCFISDATGFYWVNGLTKAVVQMFFVFSGYFFIKGGNYLSEKGQKKQLKHLLLLMVEWSAILFVLAIPQTDRGSAGWFGDYLIETMSRIGELNYGDLWYIENLIVVLAVLICLRKFEFSIHEIVILLLLTVFLQGELLRAILGIAFGMFLAKEKTSREETLTVLFRRWGWLVLVTLFVIYEMLEFYELPMDMKYVIMFVFCVSGMWIAQVTLTADLRYNAERGGTKHSYYVRKMSTLIYFIHLPMVPYIYGLVARCFPQIAALGGKNICWSGTITIINMVFSICFSVVVIILSEKKHFRWLQYLY